jgi:hypothetical protein
MERSMMEMKYWTQNYAIEADAAAFSKQNYSLISFSMSSTSSDKDFLRSV